MDPQSAMDAIEAVMDASFAAGMDPDFAELSFVVDKATGDVSVQSTSGSGAAYTGTVTLAEIATALGADVAEDAASAMPPAGGA